LQLIANHIAYSREFYNTLLEKERNDNINFLLLSMRIKSEVTPFKKDRFYDCFDLVQSISSSRKEWLKLPITQLIDQLIMTFPRHDGVHTESDLKSIVRRMKEFTDSTIISERIKHRIRNEMQQMDNINSMAVRNCTLILGFSNDAKQLVQILRAYDSKEDQPKLLQVIDVIYHTLGDSLPDDNTLMSQYKMLFPVFEQAFDHLSHGKQKNFVRRYRRVFGNRSSLRYRTNYPLFALIGLVVLVSISTLGFVVFNQRPSLISLTDSGVQHRSLIGYKVINVEDPLVIFEGTPEALIRIIASQQMENYVLSDANRALSIPVINKDRNRLEYRIIGGNFLSPRFALNITEKQLDESPVVDFTDLVNLASGIYSLDISFIDLLEGDLMDLLPKLLGNIMVRDLTLQEYEKITVYSGLDIFASSFNALDSDEFDRFISIEVNGLEELANNRLNPIIRNHQLFITVTNHAQRSSITQIDINVDSSYIELPTKLNFYSNTAYDYIQELGVPEPREQLTRFLLESYSVELRGLSLRFDSTIENIYRLIDDEEEIIIAVVLNPIDLLPPLVSIQNNHELVLEIEWKERLEDDFEGLMEEILSTLGTIFIEDKSLEQFFQDPIYFISVEASTLPDESEYVSQNFDLINFESSIFELILPKQDDLLRALGEELEFTISIKNTIFGSFSEPIKITIIDPVIE
jgi:hypothetical protein